MGGISHIGLALTVIFVISLVVLLAELLFVLWRRRIFHRQTPNYHRTTAQGRDPADSNSQPFSEVSSAYCLPFSYSKELLYFYFCMNNSRISRIQPNSSPPPATVNESRPVEEMEEVIDVFKLQNVMFGPPRFLFTIKEEEEDKYLNRHETGKKGSKESAKLEEYLKAADVDEEQSATLSAALQVEEEEEETIADSVADEHVIDLDDECGESIPSPPFSTPCESPLYFTPSASPINPLQSADPPSAAIYYEENNFRGPPDCRSFATN